MGNSNESEFIDYIDMGLHENLQPWDGVTNTAVDPGVYSFKIVDAVFAAASGKANSAPQLNMRLEIVSDGPHKGRTLRQTFTMNPEKEVSIKRLKQIHLAAGIEWTGRVAAQSFVNKFIKAEVYHDQYTALDSRTGQEVTRTGSKVRAEQPCLDFVEEAPPASTAATSANTAAAAASIPRRVVSKPVNGATPVAPRK